MKRAGVEAIAVNTYNGELALDELMHSDWPARMVQRPDRRRRKAGRSALAPASWIESLLRRPKSSAPLPAIHRKRWRIRDLT